MVKAHRLTMLASLALMALLAAPLVARDVTVKARSRRSTRRLSRSRRMRPARRRPWRCRHGDDEVTRDGKTITFDSAAIKVGETLSITVAKGDEAKMDWTCSMHPDVSEKQAGRWPDVQDGAQGTHRSGQGRDDSTAEPVVPPGVSGWRIRHVPPIHDLLFWRVP